MSRTTPAHRFWSGYSIFIVTILVIVACWIFGRTANATDIHLTCSPPTQNTDGSALTNLAGFNLYEPPLLVQNSPRCDFVQTVTTAGTHQYYVTAVNSASVESAPSNSVSATVAAPPPPFVTVSTVAYTVTNGNDRLIFLIVGSVPLGTLCDPTQAANGFNVVPRASVTFDGPTKPTTVLARCQ